MRFLRTNTAVRVTVGPFLDKTDGITPETGLTATNEKITLMVDDSNVPTLVIDATATASGGNNDMVHVTGDDAGFYDLELTAAQTNYLGRAMLAITYATDHCPVFHEFMILPAMIYDSLVLGTDRLDTNVTHAADTAWGSGAITAGSIASDAIANAKIADGAITAAKIASDAITAAKIADGAIDAATFATGAITAAALAADAGAEIADAVWDEAQAGHVSAGTFGAYVDASISGVSSGGVSAADIADAVLARNVSNVESSAGEHTLCTVVLAMMESSISGGTWTIKRTNGSTTHATKTVTSDASANPITGVS